jgi:hypothetical protein
MAKIEKELGNEPSFKADFRQPLESKNQAKVSI